MPESAVAQLGSIAGRRGNPLLILLGLVAIPVLILDQVTKFYVSSHLDLFESIPVIPHWFDITYTRNPGAAFSMFTNLPGWFRGAFLVTLSLAAIVALLVLIARSDGLNMTTFSFALILAGAAGNLIDRALRGQVIDFIRVHYYDLNYPIFNIADSAITIGVALIILSSLRSTEKHS
ncbi:MAG TPA: signal peptidase II [Candidatus Binataceae bacterium]|nr:signal peptidase II [Candidatus Binataceae bacterium]